MNRVDGKVAIVTGAAGGIGDASARLLAQAGAKVIVTDVRRDAGQRLAAAIGEAGGTAVFLEHDVTREDDWQRVVDTTLERFGSLNVLVNNAGIAPVSKIEDMTVDFMDTLYSVNLKGLVLGTKQAIRAMKATPKDADSASIVNLSSIAGLVGSAFLSMYSLTKGGVRLFTKSTAIEVAVLGYNIRCNSIHPGVIDTEMGATIPKLWEARGFAPEDAVRRVAERHLLGRMGRPDEVARAVLFLASNDSGFMTGSEMVVDGGLTAQ